MGTYFDDLLPDWPFSSLTLGLGLFQSLLLMVLLVVVDPLVHGWATDSLRPKSAFSSTTPTLEQVAVSPLKIGERLHPRFFFFLLFFF